MHAERLLLLASFLETLKSPIDFNLSTWASTDLSYNANLVNDSAKAKLAPDQIYTVKLRKKAEPECGYSACAIGHAAMMPEFRSLGLYLTYRGTMAGRLIPYFDGEHEWRAVEKFFDINETQAHKLFTDDHYESANPSAKEVAKAIRKFVRKHQ
jgi:hypothetical protein